MANTTEELVLRISGDPAGGVAAVTQVADALRGTKTSLETVKPAADETKTSLDSLGGVATKLKDALEHPTLAAKGLSEELLGPLKTALGGSSMELLALGGVAVAAGVGLYGLASRAAEIDSKLDDLHDTTQVSVEGLSRLGHATEVMNRPLEQATNLIFMMQKRMEENPDEFEKGLGRLNLSMRDLQGLQPDEQMLRIAKAFREAGPEVNRAATSYELYGKQGREAIAMLMDLDKAMVLTAGVTPITAEQAAAAEDFEMKTRALKLELDEMALTVGRALLPAMSLLVDGLSALLHGFQEHTPLVREAVEVYHQLANALGNAALAEQTAAAHQDTINYALSQGAPAGIKFGDAVQYIRDRVRDLSGGSQGLEDAEALLKKWKDGLDKAGRAAEAQAGFLKLLTQETGYVAGGLVDLTDHHAKATEATNKHTQAIQSLLTTLVGAPVKIDLLIEAWHRLTPAQQADADVIKNVLAAYEKLRPHLSASGLPADLEHLRMTFGKLTAAHEIWHTANDTSALALQDFSDVAENARLHVLEPLNATALNFGVVTLPVLVANLQPVAGAVRETHDSLDDLADGFVRMGQAAGGAMSGIVGGIGQVLNAIKMLKKTQQAEAEDNNGGSGGMNWAAFGSIATMGVAGGVVQGLGADTSGGFNKAMVTGMIGSSAGSAAGAIALGIATLGISVGVSAAVAGLKYIFRDRTVSDIAKDAGTKFGETWSAELLKTVAANAKAFHDEVTGELVSLPDIIKEHPIDASNVVMYTGKVRDLFVAIGTAHLTAAQAAQTLDAVFPQLAAAATDANGRISAGLRDIIQLNDQYHTQSKAIAAWQQGQGANAIAGFIETLGGAAIATKQDLTDLAAQAMAAYTAAVAAGMSEAAALTQIGPALLALQKNYQDLGFDVDDVGLKTLMLQSQILTASPRLAAGVKGISDEMVALDNLGLLTVDQFAAMQRTGYGMFVQLQDQAAKLGGDSKDALLPMQAYLHQAQIEALALGVPLDANTQMLIGQSKELGIWKETGKSAADKLTDAMTTLVDKVSQLVDTLRGVKQGIEDIPKHTDVEIVQHFRQGDEDNGETRSAAHEGFFARPTTVRVGDDPRGEGEYVLHKSTVDRLVRQARLVSSAAVRSLGSPQLSAAGASAAAAAQGASHVSIPIHVEGSVITQQELLDFLMRGLYNQASLLGGLVPAVNG